MNTTQDKADRQEGVDLKPWYSMVGILQHQSESFPVGSNHDDTLNFALLAW